MNRQVWELELLNTTPLLVGWYDPREQDPIGLRATEIKGLWRWWCRAFIAGAMYDLNMLNGKNGGNIYLVPSLEEARAISCFVGKILGLGYAGEKGAESSRFKLFVQACKNKNINISEYEKDSAEYQRIRFLSRKESVKGIDRGHKFVLRVEKVREKYREPEDLALKILLVSLQLSGIGKGSRRGLGSMDVLSMNPNNALGNIGDDIGKLVKQVYEESVEIVNKHLEVCGLESGKQESNKVLPPLPAVSREAFKLYKAETKDVGDFIKIHQFFVRTERCGTIKGRRFCKDDLRERYNAWFLGLPRKQKDTGYEALSKQVVRRPSPIFITYHEQGNILGQGAFVSIFLSGDWPKKLVWRGGKSRIENINIDETRIKEARDSFINEFKIYLGRKSIELQEIKW
ncbi:MAG: type III-B CRISPR module RAMP protein Cmr1 [Desulfurococcaceae archaeon]